MENDIAIIGMSCRFPGANSTLEYWENLIDNKNCITRFTYDDLLAAGVSPDIIKGKNYVSAKGVIQKANYFAADLFDFTPRESELLDPQVRLLLEESWRAINDAGIIISNNNNMGVFAGTSRISTYLDENLLKNSKIQKQFENFDLKIFNGIDYAAQIVAYRLGLRGPSINIHTACSTSLAAIHYAIQSLLSYECDCALVSAASINMPLKSGYIYREGMVLSPDGACRAFSNSAKGTVLSDGVAAVVLKRLGNALADGDQVYAIIKGSAINNDGSNKINFTAPSPARQTDVILAALSFSNINPEEITYLEAHGTGTELGDPIEVSAATEAYRKFTFKTQYCALGAVKTNIGHCDVVAGLAGLIKATLACYYGVIPATLYCDIPNPKIKFNESPFYVNCKNVAWHSHQRIAGLSSFALGGTNVHLILSNSTTSVNTTKLKSIVLPQRNKYWIYPDNLSTQNPINELKITSPPINWYKPQWREISINHLTAISNSAYHNIILLYDENTKNDYVDYCIDKAETNLIKLSKYLLLEDKFDKLNFFKQDTAHDDPLWIIAMIPSIDVLVAGTNEIEEFYYHHCWSIIHLLNYLYSKNQQKSVQLSIITEKFFSLNTYSENPIASFVNAFVLTATNEYPWLNVNVFDVQSLSDNFYPMLISQSKGTKINAYRDNSIFELKYDYLSQENFSDNTESNQRLQKNGVYILIGGTGGIGITLAKYLLQQWQAKVFLISRCNNLNAELHENGNYINKDGCNQNQLSLMLSHYSHDLILLKADVSSFVELKAAIEIIKQKNLKINGVFHLAGIADGVKLKDLYFTSFMEILKPKVMGTINIAKILMEYDFDFLMLFSSLSSVMSNVGNFSYTLANTFLDNFAPFFSHYTGNFVQTINWPGWQEVGMLANTVNEKKNHVQHTVSLFKDDWICNEHCYNNKPILPATYYLNKSIELFNLDPSNSFHIEVINYHRPVGCQTNVKLNFQSQYDQLSENYKFNCILDDDVYQKPVISGVYNLTKLSKINKVNLLKSLDKRLPSSDAKMSINIDHGEMSFGPHWNCLNRFWIEESEAFAEIIWPSYFLHERNDFLFHPAMIDVALAFPLSFIKKYYAPYQMYGVNTYAITFPETIYSHIVWLQQDITKDTIICYVELMDILGNVIFTIDKYILRAM